MHNGVDIAMPKGTAIPSTSGGTIVYAQFGQKGSGYGGYGNVVVVRDNNGYLHQYSHLDSINVKVGQKVGSGALLGKAGSTGRSTGPHLDYIVKNSKGSYVDPTPFIMGGNKPTTNTAPASKLAGLYNEKTTTSSYSNFTKLKQAKNSSSFQSYLGHLKSAVNSGLVPSNWALALSELVGRESSWNSGAKNPNSTASGYGQFLNSTVSQYAKKTGLNYNNPVHQLGMMAQYVKDRYGSPEKALAFWDKNRWY